MVEVQVKATYVEEAVVGELVRSDRRLRRMQAAARTAADADYAARLELGRRFASLLSAHRRADVRRVVGALERLAARTEMGDPTGDFGVANVAFLVHRSQVAGFQAAVEGLAAEESGRMSIRTVGPTAPYSFVDGTLAGVG